MDFWLRATSIGSLGSHHLVIKGIGSSFITSKETQKVLCESKPCLFEEAFQLTGENM